MNLGPDLLISSPTASTVFEAGRTHSVCWACSKLEALFRIELYDGDRFVTLLHGKHPNTGIYRWRIPAALNPSDQYSIYLVDLTQPQLCGKSAPFMIRAASSSLQKPEASSLHYAEASSLQKVNNPWPLSFPIPSNSSPAPIAASMALIEDLLREGAPSQSEGPERPRKQVEPSKPVPSSVDVGTVARQSSAQSKVPVRQFQARSSSVLEPKRNAIALTSSEVRRCLSQMLNESDIHVDYVLSNGDTVGQFSIKYLLSLAQNRESKKRNQS